MDWVYLSPHLDDVALSCGGLIWEQTNSGAAVSIWTVCAGDPPELLSPFAKSLHSRWDTGDESVEKRRVEDIYACKTINASSRHFPIPDCIYRWSSRIEEFEGKGYPDYLYTSEESLFGDLHPTENELIADLSVKLAENLPSESKVVCPLALGGHVDHRLTRAAAELMQKPLLYYADFPYVLGGMSQLDRMRNTGWRSVLYPISEAGISAWEQSVASYKSQISTFWPDVAAMKDSLRSYYQRMGGVFLWEWSNGGEMPRD
jgi:LmbE family N-acetylglucosaminyl deacetylase